MLQHWTLLLEHFAEDDLPLASLSGMLDAIQHQQAAAIAMPTPLYHQRYNLDPDLALSLYSQVLAYSQIWLAYPVKFTRSQALHRAAQGVVGRAVLHATGGVLEASLQV